jgi:protein transport protein SEC24
MFDKADAIANASVLAKLAVEKSLKSRLDETRAAVDKKLVAQLKEYKGLQATAARAPGRLLYPKSMRMMMPWLLGMLKSPALRGGPEVNPDERCAVGSLVLVCAPLSC